MSSPGLRQPLEDTTGIINHITDFYSHCSVFSVGWHDLCNSDDHLMIAMKNTADSGSVNVVCGVNIMSSCSMFAVVLILTPHSLTQTLLESKHK